MTPLAFSEHVLDSPVITLVAPLRASSRVRSLARMNGNYGKRCFRGFRLAGQQLPTTLPQLSIFIHFQSQSHSHLRKCMHVNASHRIGIHTSRVQGRAKGRAKGRANQLKGSGANPSGGGVYWIFEIKFALALLYRVIHLRYVTNVVKILKYC